MHFMDAGDQYFISSKSCKRRAAKIVLKLMGLAYYAGISMENVGFVIRCRPENNIILNVLYAEYSIYWSTETLWAF